MATEDMEDIHLGDESSSTKLSESENLQETPTPTSEPATSTIDIGDGDSQQQNNEAESNVSDSDDAPQLHEEVAYAYPTPTKALKGETRAIDETKFYVVGEAKNCQKLVIVLTNYLGTESKNNLLTADAIHEAVKLPVVVVDSTGNNPAQHVMRIKGSNDTLPPPQPNLKTQSSSSFLGQVKSWFAGSVSGFFDDMWLAAHSFEVTIGIVRSGIEKVFQEYNPEDIVVVGYGFGARYVMSLLKRSNLFNPHEEDDEESSPWEIRDKASAEDHIISGIAVNPSFTSLEDFKLVYKPLLFIHSDDNELLPQSLVEEGFRSIPGQDSERKLISQETPLPHGFAIPGDYSEDVVGNKPQEVIDLIAKWINKQ